MKYLINMEFIRLLIIVFFICGCNDKNSELNDIPINNGVRTSNTLIGENSVLNSMLSEFLKEISFESKEGYIVLMFDNKDNEYYFSIYESMSSYMPIYPEEYFIVDGYLVFVYTKFGELLSQEKVKGQFNQIIKTYNLELTDIPSNKENRTWIVKMNRDSILNVDKIWE